MGLEAIERIEVICAELAAEVFGAKYAEGARRLRRAGQPLRLHGHLQTRRHHHRAAGDIGGHVTTMARARPGLYGLKTVPAPVLADGYTVDVAALDRLARGSGPS